MAFVKDIRTNLQRLLVSPADELGRWTRMLRFQLQLWRFCLKRLREHNMTAMSAALSFRTIFAMIPTLVLALLVMKSLGALDDSKQSLRQVLEASGFAQIAVLDPDIMGPPAELEVDGEPIRSVASEIESMVLRVEKQLSFAAIGPVGAVLLIYTAISLLTTMERSLNRIFGAARVRSFGARMVLYWSVVTLSPLTVVAAVILGRQALRAVEVVPGVGWLLAAVGWTGPIIVGILVLAAVYKLLPNAAVPYRSAVGAAIVAVPLWVLARWGFALYVSNVVSLQNLYGALGLLPLFLIWINLSWLIFLFGAELAHTASNLRSLQSEEWARAYDPGPLDLLACAVALAQSFVRGGRPVKAVDLAAQLRLPTDAVGSIVERLEGLGVVGELAVGDGAVPGLVFTRPMGQVRLVELLELGSASPVDSVSDRYAPEVGAVVSQVIDLTELALGDKTLAELIPVRIPPAARSVV